MDWREASNYRPKGHAALGRSTSLKPPALPEVTDMGWYFSVLLRLKWIGICPQSGHVLLRQWHVGGTPARLQRELNAKGRQSHSGSRYQSETEGVLRRECRWVWSASFSGESNAALVAPFNSPEMTKLGCRNGAASWAECSGGAVRSRGSSWGKASLSAITASGL